MYMVAAYLRMTLADLSARMSAQEFAGWLCWLNHEGQGAKAEGHRHAQALAAMHNSGKVQHRERRLFEASDFTLPDPWAPPPEKPKADAVSAADFVARLSAGRATMRGKGLA